MILFSFFIQQWKKITVVTAVTVVIFHNKTEISYFQGL